MASAAEPSPGAQTALADLTGIGPQRAKLLAKLGLVTIEDALVRHLPLRHEDRSQVIPLGRITVGEARTCAGTIAGISPPPRGAAADAPRRHHPGCQRLPQLRLVQPALSRPGASSEASASSCTARSSPTAAGLSRCS